MVLLIYKTLINDTWHRGKPWGPEETQLAECSFLCWYQSTEWTSPQWIGVLKDQVHRQLKKAVMKPLNPTGPHSESAEPQGIIAKELRKEWEKAVLGIVQFCCYLKIFLHAIQEHHFGLELLKLQLEFWQHWFALRTFGVHKMFYRLHWKLYLWFGCTSTVTKWLANLCSFSLVESASGRNFSFSLDSLFQLSAAVAVPNQKKKKNHTKSKGPKITTQTFHWKKPSGVSTVHAVFPLFTTATEHNSSFEVKSQQYDSQGMIAVAQTFKRSGASKVRKQKDSSLIFFYKL